MGTQARGADGIEHEKVEGSYDTLRKVLDPTAQLASHVPNSLGATIPRSRSNLCVVLLNRATYAMELKPVALDMWPQLLTFRTGEHDLVTQRYQRAGDIERCISGLSFTYHCNEYSQHPG
jgi:hypothetical protein